MLAITISPGSSPTTLIEVFLKKFTMLIEFITTLITIIIGIIIYFKWSFKYWQKKGLPSLEPTFPFGNMENPFSRKYSIGVLMKRHYEEFKSRGCKHGGLYSFSSPVYIPIHPEYVKNIMQKDFHYFVDRGSYYNEKDDPLSAHLFAIGGQKWRNLRVKLTPTFTSGKMKIMFDTLLQYGDQMKISMDKLCENRQAIDIKEVVARFSTDIIGSCAFGLECNSFKNSNAEFRAHGKNIFEPQSKLKAIVHMFATANPEIGHSFGAKFLPEESTGFFLNVIQETVSYREKNGFARNDLLQLLIDLKNKKGDGQENQGDGKNLTLEELTAQAFIFFIAGFETSSTTMTFCLFELARNQEIQEKVREDINNIWEKHQGKITYEAIKEMKYLNQVIDETLRKYPALPFLNRVCVKNYKVPNTEMEIEKGTMVFLSVLGLHYDPDHFPDPEKFDPERFSEENKKLINPFSYIPFGAGPRMCIGLRFGMVQTKLGLITLLKNYRFCLNKQMEIPLKINPYTVILTSDRCILLDAEKIV